MSSGLGTRLRERTLDAMDWVDFRSDPHWTSFAAVPAALALSLYFIPDGFLPLFLVLCAMAAVVSFVLVVFGIAAWIVGWAARDMISDGLAAMRGAVGDVSARKVLE